MSFKLFFIWMMDEAHYYVIRRQGKPSSTRRHHSEGVTVSYPRPRVSDSDKASPPKFVYRSNQYYLEHS